MRKKILVLIPILVLLIFSCKAPGGPEEFEPLEAESEGNDTLMIEEVRSIEPGAFIYEEETIPIEIDMKTLSDEPARLQIDLLDRNGAVAATQKYDFAADESSIVLPELALPKLNEGQYTLRYRMYNADEELFYEEQIPFFYTAGGYEITGIRSYPNAIQPRSTALLKAALGIPKGTDPYLRWKLGDSVIHEGYFSHGAADFAWVSPKIEGIYTISLELFPVMPEGEMLFSSEIGMTTEIYVTAEPSPQKSELQPEAWFYSLFHFRGNTNESGYREGIEKATPIGLPEPGVTGERYGYLLDGNAGFLVPELLLPVENGRIKPFSIVINGAFPAQQPDVSIFTAAAADGAFSFTLSTGSDGLYQAVFESGDDLQRSAVPGLAGAFSSLILTVIPEDLENGGPGTSVLWYFDDSLVYRETLSIDPVVRNGEGRSLIGGENGFTGLLDEFGIFHNQTDGSAIQNVFEASLEAEYGLDLRFGEGFDGRELPETLTYEGEVFLENGVAVLPGEAEIVLPPILLRNEQVDVRIELDDDEGGGKLQFRLLFAEAGGAVVSGEGYIRIDGREKTVPVPKFQGNQIEFSLNHDGDVIILTVGDSEVLLHQEIGGSADVRISIFNTGESPIGIDSISLISTPKEIVQKESAEEKTTEDDKALPETLVEADTEVAQNAEGPDNNEDIL